jgi:multiple sugar transport system permease protein
MTGKALPLPLTGSGRKRSPRAHAIRFGIARLGVSLFAASMAMIFLLPLAYMLLTAFKDSDQMTALNAPLWPAVPEMYTAADGQAYTVYEVPTASGVQDLALEKPGRVTSTMIDPKTGQEVEWQGNWRALTAVWLPTVKLDNFATVLSALNFPMLLRNTLVVSVLGTIGAVGSAILVAFGFARFRIPGKNGLFLVLIMTIMLPFQILLIPQYIAFNAVGWTGTWLPLIVPTFFANAYNVFLLRQYFLTLPRELDEAAEVDGASLVYLSGHPDLATMTVGLQAFNATYSRAGSGTLTQAASLVAMLVPVAIFFVAQRAFLRGVVISGVDK